MTGPAEPRGAGTTVLPQGPVRPLVAVGRRVLLALALLALMVLVVYLDRDGYRDAVDDEVSLLDAAYYSTVSLSTTGYGDITPATDEARLLNTLLVTPLRILFLLVLISTTLEALTARTREDFRVSTWRRRVEDHVVLCGYGTKGRSALRVLAETGRLGEVVVVDPDPQSLAEATAAGHVGVLGSATREQVLRQAAVDRARAVVVAVDADEAAVLITLTARQLAPRATIVATVREVENAGLVRQSGADSVITSAEASGRLLGLATDAPQLVAVIEDLLVTGQGLDLLQRPVTPAEVGGGVRDVPDLVLAVARGGRLLRWDDPGTSPLQDGDVLVCLRSGPRAAG
ncbi:MAG: potassium channel family protein [Actinomycetota bacterium]|nr:potassium channel family protein [Actinomycetota bacterium]